MSFLAMLDFYPRPPRGGRLAGFVLHGADVVFLSTPSARRATADVAKQRVDFLISIHALREEGDVWSVRTTARPMIFLSTPSARRATRAIRRL